jgi:phosphatidylserine/phosphatidylglycerophosphate/cardiolipin synthase-like enzyme
VARRLLAAGVELRRVNTHDKLGLIRSRHAVSRRPRKVVLSGSHNLNHDANYVNDEILVKTFDDDLYDDMLASHVEPLWAESAPYQAVPRDPVPQEPEPPDPGDG